MSPVPCWRHVIVFRSGRGSMTSMAFSPPISCIVARPLNVGSDPRRCPQTRSTAFRTLDQGRLHKAVTGCVDASRRSIQRRQASCGGSSVPTLVPFWRCATRPRAERRYEVAPNVALSPFPSPNALFPLVSRTVILISDIQKELQVVAIASKGTQCTP